MTINDNIMVVVIFIIHNRMLLLVVLDVDVAVAFIVTSSLVVIVVSNFDIVFICRYFHLLFLCLCPYTNEDLLFRSLAQAFSVRLVHKRRVSNSRYGHLRPSSYPRETSEFA